MLAATRPAKPQATALTLLPQRHCSLGQQGRDAGGTSDTPSELNKTPHFISTDLEPALCRGGKGLGVQGKQQDFSWECGLGASRPQTQEECPHMQGWASGDKGKVG